MVTLPHDLSSHYFEIQKSISSMFLYQLPPIYVQTPINCKNMTEQMVIMNWSFTVQNVLEIICIWYYYLFSILVIWSCNIIPVIYFCTCIIPVVIMQIYLQTFHEIIHTTIFNYFLLWNQSGYLYNHAYIS